ncbi:MAG: hypothetical protein MUP74_02620 [Desulfobacterales bacterium]|nr:hypothetical protein [Desulfobacterales bacterium]
MLKALRSIGYRTRATIRGWLNTALLGTHHHYFCHLPRELGSTATLMLKLLYSGIRLDPHQTSLFKKIPADAVLVLVNQNKSYFEYLFYHTRYRRGKLPVPEIGLDYRVFLWQPLRRILRIFLSRMDYFFQHLQMPDPYKNGYVRQELLQGKTAMLPLLEKKGFYRRFVKSQVDPLRHLIEIQSEIDRPVYIVPHLMFFGKNPGRSVPSLIDILFGPEENPGILRRLVVLFRSPGRVFAEISEPVNLKAFLERPENTQRSIEARSNALRLHLLARINRHRQSITGPVLKSREEIKQSILTSERLQAFMNHYAETRNIPI